MTAEPVRVPLDGAVLRPGVVRQHGEWRRLDIVPETGSTNADLIARAGSGDDIRGAVLAADFQTAGRGRHGRQWTAPPRSQISVSVGVDVADVPSAAWGWLPLLTGVAVVQSMAATAGVTAGLKWPNDVLAGGGKLAGILAEVAPSGDVIVVGVGLNVTLTEDEVPGVGATSLAQLGASVLDRNVLLTALLDELGARIEHWRLARGSDSELADLYRQRSVTLNSSVRAQLPGDRVLVGTAVAVDDSGRLCIDTGGDVVTVSAGDITHLRPGES